MAYIPRSSFSGGGVPSAIPLQVKKRRSIKIISLSASVLFFCSVASAVGVFFYKDYVQKQLIEAKSGLSEVSSTDDPKEKIEEIRKYNNKLSIAQNLLDNHIAPSRIFDAVEAVTKETVQFKSLEFSYDPGFDAEIVLVGNTEEFASVALQKMQLNKANQYSEFVVEGVNVFEETEESEAEESIPTERAVAFTVTGIFDKDVIEYTGTVNTPSNVPSERVVPATLPAEQATSTASANTTTSSSTETNI